MMMARRQRSCSGPRLTVTLRRTLRFVSERSKKFRNAFRTLISSTSVDVRLVIR